MPDSTSPENVGYPKTMFAWAVYLFSFAAPVSTATVQAAAAFVIILGCWLFAKGTARSPLHRWALCLTALLVLVVALSAFLSNDFSAAVPQLRKSWVLLCIFPMNAYSNLFSKMKTISFLIAGTALASLIGIIRFLTGAVDRAAPFSGGYTSLALFGAAIIPLALGFWLSADRKIRWYLAFSLLLTITGLILTQTRAGWFAALVGVLVVGLMGRRKLIIPLMLMALAIIAIIPQSRQMVIERLDYRGPRGLTNGRALLWQQALEPISNLPLFGHGPGSFGKLVPYSLLEKIGDTGIKSWHSTPIDILIESGPLALLALLGIAGIAVVLIWRRLRPESSQAIFYLSLLGSLIALYLGGLTTNILRDFLLSSLLIILWSAALSPPNGSPFGGNKSPGLVS